MKKALILPLIVAAAAAQAQSPIAKEAFDGDYEGAAQLNAAMSGESCAPGGSASLTIAEGLLSGGAPSLNAEISGFITEEGFVKAEAQFAGGETAVLEGRARDGDFSAAVIQSGPPRCVYRFTFTKS